LICSNFEFYQTLINTAQTYMIGNQSFALYADSLLVTIKMNSWPFDSNSWGVRLKLLVQDRYATVSSFILQPGNVQDPILVQYNNFDAAEMQPTTDEQGQAGVKLSQYAELDGVAIAPNISGFWPHAYDINARYIYIDVPKFTTSMSYSVNLYFTSSSGSTSLSNLFPGFSSEQGFVHEYLTYIIVVAAVFGLCAIFGCMSFVYCKCCKRRRGGYD